MKRSESGRLWILNGGEGTGICEEKCRNGIGMKGRETGVNIGG